MGFRFIFSIITIFIQAVFIHGKVSWQDSCCVRQVEHYTEYEKRLEIAHKFIEAAADNIYRNLRYYKGRGKDVYLRRCGRSTGCEKKFQRQRQLKS